MSSRLSWTTKIVPGQATNLHRNFVLKNQKPTKQKPITSVFVSIYKKADQSSRKIIINKEHNIMIQGLFTQEAMTILTVYTLKKQTLAKTSHGKESILYNYS